jgi:zinc transport system substrate-binding protein
MRTFASTLLAGTALCSVPTVALAEIEVVASIKPVHSLVAAVMEGVGEPALIVEGAGSPHTYSLRPSQAAKLESADLIFWIGPEIETFLGKPIEAIGADAKAIELIESHGLVRLGFREGGAFEGHEHGDDDHDDHEAMAASEHDDDHDHEETAASEHDDDHGHEETAASEHDHDHGAFDGHVWLDPENAKVIVHEIEEALVAQDPDNAATYEANAAAVTARLDALIGEVETMLAPVKDKGFIVFHDAYHYFERRFGVTAAGSITVSPDVMPGAERVREVQARIRDLGATCVFAEPQFEPKLVAVVVEGSDAQSGVLDPLGANLDDGPDLYFELIRNLATSMRDCLAEAS